MVIVPKYEVKYKRVKIFLINSKEEYICPCCGSPFKYRDSRKRVYRIAGGGKEWYLIRRAEIKQWQMWEAS